ncbi:NADPH-dependent FMN reductase [Microvirga sp. KLBC 81]|uniref:NADPH-dependent FMN reductase n=1 Tax=Microvirga sp. KLBC 81 TaxID=1862707 RepID=UPI00197BEDB5|nr:hypothetical protein [Microvirga sp. KLBC 81]
MASAIVCYSGGRFGGVRAAMQLLAILRELGMPSIPSLLPIPKIGMALSTERSPEKPRLDQSAGRFVDELVWYAEALRRQRAEDTPYESLGREKRICSFGVRSDAPLFNGASFGRKAGSTFR